MRALWLAAGIVIGLAVAGLPFGDPTVGAAGKALQPAVIKWQDVLAKGLKNKAGGFSFDVLAEAPTGGVELFTMDRVDLHYHPNENHFLYILRGRAAGRIGTITAEVGPGDLVVIPAGKAYQHKFSKIGSESVVFLLFSSPPFKADDIQWVK